MRMLPGIESRRDQFEENCISASGSSSFRHARTILLIVFSVTMVAYFTSYVVLRNRGIEEMPQLGVGGFLYDSIEHVEQTHDLSVHHFRSTLYWPVNEIDQVLFGGPAPILCILFELS
jgi:hypothetical protein